MDATGSANAPLGFRQGDGAMDQRLAFCDQASVAQNDPDVFAESLSTAIPLKDLGAIGSAKLFRNRCVTIRAGSTTILSGTHTPLFGSTEESSKATLLLTLGGEAHYWIQKKSLEAKGTLTALFLPGSAYSAQTDNFNGVIFTVSPKRILDTASAMAGLEAPAAEMKAHIVEARQMHLGQAERSAAILGLRHALDLFDIPNRSPADLAESLGVEDVMHRCIALMLFPWLLEGDSEDARTRPSREEKTENIEDFLMANLGSRITLTQIEQRFRLSRRTLQQAFRAKHGCGPMQWQRRQRLRYARKRIFDRDRQAASVSSIAQECGYTNLSSFSRDFKELFAVSPSEYLRS